MSKKPFKIEFLIALLLSIVFILIDKRISLGILLGFLFSFLNYRLIEYRYKNIDTYNVLAILGSLICIALLGIPLLISFLLPNIFNYIGVVIGLLIIKVKLIIEAFIKKWLLLFKHMYFQYWLLQLF